MLAAGAGWAAPVLAQNSANPGQNQAGTVQNTIESRTVAQREIDADTDTGFRLGSFTVRPRLLVDATVTDNLFATPTGREGDVFTTIAPEVSIQSDWVHSAVAARAYYSRSVHARFGSEDASQYGGSVDTRLDLAADTQLSINALGSREVESRSSLGSFRQLSTPARFTQFGGQATLRQTFGQFGVSLIGRGYRLAYSDALLNGVPVSQRYRTFNIYSGAVQTEYSINHLTALVVRATAEFRRYDLRPGEAGFDPISSTDRSADGVRIEAGAVREITSLLYASFRLGYLRFDYADARLRDVGTFSYLGNLRWNITPLTTIGASAERRLDETTSPLTAGDLRDEFGVSVDHELLRTLVLSGALRYALINPAGISPSSREFAANAGARYRLGRSVRLSLNVDHSQRTSSLADITYKENRLTLGVRYAR